MQFNTKVNVVKLVKVSDGMGGYTSTNQVIAILDAYLLPVSVELMLKSHGVVSTKATKILTKSDVPASYDFLLVGSTKYKTLQFMDLSKIKTLLVEEIS